MDNFYNQQSCTKHKIDKHVTYNSEWAYSVLKNEITTQQ